jgi:hypothetical protein
MRPRFRAFLIHLSASIALALLALVLVFGVWYPAPLHKAAGVTAIFLIVLGVDVVIGPMLTFVVYKVGKKSLRFDLATIVCLQLAAFSYGLWTVAEGRPAWLVFSVDQFVLVQAYEIDDRKLSEALPMYRHPSLFGPGWAAARRANDAERSDVLIESLQAGLDIAQRPNFYSELNAATDGIRQHAQPLGDLERFNQRSEVAAVLARWPEADAFLPLMSRVHPVTVLINKASARVVAVVDLNPWE